jgi:chromosome condensin MukBEF ATPase and DNA-binding subunit MukB
MKDDATSIVTGILIQSETQRRNDEIRREQQFENNRLAEEKNTLKDQNNIAKKKNNALTAENDDLLDDLQTLQIQNKALYNKAKELQTAYEEKMQIMAEWMVSQKAFKELAIQFGFEKGLSTDEVIELGNEKKLDVLDNKHDPEHGTNANGVSTIENRVEILKEKINKQLNK